VGLIHPPCKYKEGLVMAIVIDNDTPYTRKQLNNMQWHKVQEEASNYSIVTAITYINAENTIAKKIYNDGFIEYYEI
jgi:hypothetical protein